MNTSRNIPWKFQRILHNEMSKQNIKLDFVAKSGRPQVVGVVMNLPRSLFNNAHLTIAPLFRH